MFPYKSLKKVNSGSAASVPVRFCQSFAQGPECPNVQIFLHIGLKGSAAGQDNCTDKCFWGVQKRKGCSAGTLCDLTTCLLLLLDFFIA